MERGERPWGTYTVLDEHNGYKIKRIEVFPGQRLSLQMHHHRSEHWIVVSGTAKVTCGDTVKIVNINESTFIPIGSTHRLENPGVIPLVIIEVQSGEYLGEDDIVRFQDDYHRVEAPAAESADDTAVEPIV
ncbi:phosphomannose isomerase type II C-terminal cupin domain [Geomonas sp. Red69]|uniref:phosphomannose isomerase type II C-terminal cupin domain n=1 Tax=Geomonas diazotrophica TaxID=2843197 RepID=UPI001C1153FF|nr:MULTISPECIES: phosphomannose isomerase type II C-terminal cupin domain [Geomonas]MBU5638646.1 phosphomannose isomerase type II C-terminal cupin domain [Geomonas diazotrophica]QXE87506.1 phosphomannose isomerase type II C-terminal cupin domain [Geomonas nitrogeniifigens]